VGGFSQLLSLGCGYKTREGQWRGQKEHLKGRGKFSSCQSEKLTSCLRCNCLTQRLERKVWVGERGGGGGRQPCGEWEERNGSLWWVAGKR